MKRIIVLLLAIGFGSFAAFSQLGSEQVRVQLLLVGTATPLSDVTVSVDGKEVGKSDQRGWFTFRLDQEVKEICFYGLETQRKCVSRNWVLEHNGKEVYLETEDHTIETVRVQSGYEGFSMRNATGSYTVINKVEFDRQVHPHVLSRLEGLAPGLLFYKQGGVDHLFSIRGMSTINSDQWPLIIVDGFPYEGDISLISPDDVADITVLKDAAAAAIWGAKAGNGVVVITTKRGGQGSRMQIHVSANTGVVDAPDLYYQPQISSADFIGLERFLYDKGAFNALLNNTRVWPVMTPVIELLHQHSQGLIDEQELQQQLTRYGQHDLREDLQKYVYRPGINQQYRMSVRSGGAVSSQMVSIGYDRTQKNQVGNDGARLTIRANNDLQLSKFLQLATGLSYSSARDRTNGLGPLSLGMSRAIYPYARLADEAGNPAVLEQDYRQGYVDTAGRGMLLDWRYRPLDEVNHRDFLRNRSDLILSSVLTAKLLPTVSFQASYQYTRSQSETDNYQSVDAYAVRNLINRFTQVAAGGVPKYAVPMGGMLDAEGTLAQGHAIRTKVDWNQTWADRHRLDLLAAFEVSTTDASVQRQRWYGYDPDLKIFGIPDYVNRHPIYGGLASNAVIPHQASMSATTNRFVSLLANGRYVYDDRYIVSLSARRDASNLFGVSTNNKWKPLWSAGAAWNVHKERFWNTDVIPLLKLRMSHGYSGNVNNAVPAVLTMQYGGSLSPLGRAPYALVRNPPNADLRWEEVRTTNMALDFELTGQRLRGSMDVYFKRSTDLISSLPVDPTTGFDLLTKNAADLENWGWDLNLSSQNIQGMWQWNTDFILSRSKPVVTKNYQIINNPSYFVGTGVLMNPLEGHPLYPLFSYHFGGLSAERGDPILYLNGEPSTDYAKVTQQADFDDLIFHGSVNPTYFGSLNNSLSYKGFRLDVRMSYRFGYYFRRSTVVYSNLLSSNVIHTDYYDRWLQSGDEAHTTVPSLTYPFNGQRDQLYEYSDATVQKGDHIRLQNLGLSYSLDQAVFGFQSLQAFLLVDNLNWFVWKASRTNLDPDIASGRFPFSRSYNIGLKLTL